MLKKRKYTVFLLKFITKIIFNSKHSNYNIHFLNTVAVRWRPLSTHSPKRFWKLLHHLLQHVGRNCCHFFPDVLFQIHRCPWFLFVHLALKISSEKEVLRLGTLVPMNIEGPTKYPLSQDRIVVFEIVLHSKNPMPYRPALNGNWNGLSRARRALNDKFPAPTVPLTVVLPDHQVFQKICITYIFRTQLRILTQNSTLGIQTTCFGPVYWPSSGCAVNLTL